MKRVLLVALVILSACHQKPLEIATRNMEAYLKQKYNDPDSFKFIRVNSLVKDWQEPHVDSGFVKLDSGLTIWAFFHNKSKMDHKVLEKYVDSLNKARPDSAKEMNRNLKLAESGKLDMYYTTCTFIILNKRHRDTFFYSFKFDTTYKVTQADDLTHVIFE
ncbi:MAG TPA: hypothetical protein VFE54_12640 [Mucilaginibacter sp.]|nr:hypothetical protein [Mucilaginibacter sp.]